MSVSLFGQPVIILGSIQHAVALLDKRGALYSDRPRLVMAGDLVGISEGLGMMPYGARFREYRRMIQKFLGGRGDVARFYALEEQETKKWLKRVLNDPQNVAKHIRTCVLAIIPSFLYFNDRMILFQAIRRSHYENDIWL